MYPALGFYPYDPRLEKMYDYAQDMQLPIMTHCTKSGVYFKGELTREQLRPLNMNSNPCKKDYVTERVNSKFKNNFSHPDNYRDVLDLFPDLKLCIAHFGGSSQMRLAKENPSDKSNWYNIVKDLVAGNHTSQFYTTEERINDTDVAKVAHKKCANVYTDVSYTLSDSKVYNQLASDLKDENIGRKILFGTDYYMTNMEKPEEKVVYDFYKAFREQTFRNMPLSEMMDQNAVDFLNSKVYKA